MASILPEFIQQAFRAKHEELYKKAESIFVGWKFQRAILTFDLKGKCAGIFTRVPASPHCNKLVPIVRLHEEFCFYEYEDMLNDTLPHEVAHHLVYEVFEKTLPGEFRKPGRKPHGTEWHAIASMLGAKPMARCHNYPMARCRRTGGVRPLAAINAELEIEKKQLLERIVELEIAQKGTL